MSRKSGGKGFQTSMDLAQNIFRKAAEGKRLAEKRKRQAQQSNAVEDPFPFAKLPFDLQEMIFRYLPASEIGMCCAVCKAWGHIYQGAVASIFAKVVGVARGRSKLMRRAELQLIHRLRNTHEKETAIETTLWAAFNGYVDYVLRLLDERKNIINVNTPGSADWDFATLIHVACRQGNLKLVRALLDRGADPAVSTKGRQTPLILASEYGFPHVVDFLLKRCGRDLNLNAQDSQGRTALFIACEKAHFEVVNALVDYADMIQQETGEADPIVDLNLGIPEKGSPLCVACRMGQSKIVKRLLESPVNVNAITEDRRTAFFCAVERGAINTTRLLLEKRPPITSSEMADMLYRSRPHAGMEAALQLVETETEVPNVHPSAAGVLIDFASNTGKTPVYLAAERGNVDLLNVLIAANADTKKPTFLNKTPLYAATENGHTEVVRELLRHSTREHVLHQTNFGTTAPFMAQRNGHMQIKNLLSEFCMEKLTVEKAKKKKSKKKQNDAINRLMKKDKKPSESTAAKQEAEISNVEEAKGDSESEKLSKDIIRSKEAVQAALDEVGALEEAAARILAGQEAGQSGMQIQDQDKKQLQKENEQDDDEGDGCDKQVDEVEDTTVPENPHGAEIKEAETREGIDDDGEEYADDGFEPEADDAETEEEVKEEGVKDEQVDTCPKALVPQKPSTPKPSREEVRRERAAFFEKKFAKDPSTANLPAGDSSEGRLVPKKEKDVMAARRWSATFIDSEDRSDSPSNDLAARESSELTLKSIRGSLLTFSSITSSYKMSEDIFDKSFANKENSFRKVFDLMKGSKEVANAWDVFVAATLLSKESPEDKLGFCFGLFDSKSLGYLDSKVSKTLLKCCSKSIRKLRNPNNVSDSKEEMEALADDLMSFDNDVAKDVGEERTVTKDKFVRWARESPQGSRLFAQMLHNQ